MPDTALPADQVAAFCEVRAAQAERVIAQLEAGGDDSPDCLKLRHELRGLLATLRAALEVRAIAPASSGLAQEADAIAQRSAAQLDDKLKKVKGADHGERTDR